MSEKMRVVIADDERPARSLLASMLRSFDDVAVVGEAKDGSEAVELIERLRPDLALLDSRCRRSTAWAWCGWSGKTACP
jgi:DNA-binding NarL/FixJ family response regulator